jgi:hypothetical protein
LIEYSITTALFSLVAVVVDAKQQSCEVALAGADDVNGRLHEYLCKRVRPYTRPVLHPSDCVEIHVSSALYHIVDLVRLVVQSAPIDCPPFLQDQRNNLATISAYFDVWWIDPFLRWNPSEFDGVDRSFLPTDSVWKPEFYLYHRFVFYSIMDEHTI